MPAAHVGNAIAIQNTTTNTTLTGTFTDSIAVGDRAVAFVVRDKTDAVDQTAVVTDESGNTWDLIHRDDTSGLTSWLYIFASDITTTVDVGDDFTVTFNNSASRKAATVEVWNLADGTWGATTAGLIASNAPAGSFASATVGPTTAVPTAPHLTVAALQGGGALGANPTLSWTEMTYIITTAGSSNRNITSSWSTATVDGQTVSAGFNLDASGGYVAVLATFPYTETGATVLDTPAGFTFDDIAGTRTVVASWSAVTDADSYTLEVEILDDGGDPEDEGDWSPLTPTSEFNTENLTYTLDQTNGLDYEDVVRGRITAIAPV